MRLKNSRWTMVMVTVIAFLMVGTMVWASPPAGAPSAPLQAYDAKNADKVDGLHASKRPKANTLLALRKNKKFPASVIPGAITRDGEVMSIVKKNDGSGSGLDADLLDGQEGAYYLTLGGLSCTNGQIAEWDGSAWTCADPDGGGDITAVYAGTGLSGGGTSGEVTLSLAAVYQLPQTCSNGEMAKWNNATSTWECAADSDTTYSAGDGLTLVGTTFALGVNYAGSSSKGGPALDLSCSNCISSGELGVNYAGSSSKGGSALDLSCADCISSGEIAAGAVTSAEIQAGAVSASDLQDGAALAEILDDDGSGSGLDGDLLDGLDSCAYANGGDWVYQLSKAVSVNTWTTITSTAVTTPCEGFVFVTATCAMQWTDGSGYPALGIGQNATTPNVEVNARSTCGSGLCWTPGAVSYVYGPSAAGNYDFYLLGKIFDGSGTVNFYDCQLTAIFIPNRY